MRIAIVVGTRPEIIKMSPVIKACQTRGVDFVLIDTKQHYSDNMSGSFFRELELPTPDYTLEGATGSHGTQISSMLVQFEEIFQKEPFDVVLVQGDTNTVLAAGLMASRHNISVGHVEAGLRSGDRTMPEEINRVMVDHISDYLFATSDETHQNLHQEGIPRAKTWNTGNTIVDATFEGLKLARQTVSKSLPELPKDYILVTLHRASNVDNPDILKGIIDGIQATADVLGLKVVFPIHPRTRKNLDAAKITLSPIFQLIEPQGYLDFLRLQSNAALIMSDSGGIQEEACIMRVPCVTLRDNTERPETIAVGANILGGTNKHTILDAALQMINQPREWSIPYGDGSASSQILDIISGSKAMQPVQAAVTTA